MFAYSEILPELWVGSHPRSRTDIKRLDDGSDITAVLNLQTDTDIERLAIDWAGLAEHYRHRGVETKRVPVVDFDPLDLRKKLPFAVQTLNELIAGGHNAYVHCTLGISRAPSVAIAYLTWIRDWGLDKAWYHVKEHHDCAPSFEAIWLATRDRLEKINP